MLVLKYCGGQLEMGKGNRERMRRDQVTMEMGTWLFSITCSLKVVKFYNQKVEQEMADFSNLNWRGFKNITTISTNSRSLEG